MTISRRRVLTAAAATTWAGGSAANAANPIKIGMPLALTGPLGSVGEQMRRGAELWRKVQNAQGGLLGRQIEIVISDTGGDPATCVRKAQEMVERDGCRIFFGMTLSSEALAVVPKLGEWESIFVSSDNGDGRLTAESLVPNFFRSNISAPMGARAVTLFLKDAPYKSFYAIGMDYAWGRGSVAVFENEMKRASKNFAGSVFSPTGTKDFSSYITKIRQSGADALYVVLAGDDYAGFLTQAKQYRLGEKVQMITEVVDMQVMRSVGDASAGLIGSTRYCATIDTPLNKEYVAMWLKEYGFPPDNNEGEQWQACQVLQAAILKAGSTDLAPLRAALTDVAITSIKGPIAMRSCDHQMTQPGYMVKVTNPEGSKWPVPEVIATYPAERTAPGCNKMTYDD